MTVETKEDEIQIGRESRVQKVQFLLQMSYLASLLPPYIYHSDMQLLQVVKGNFPSKWGKELLSFIFFHFLLKLWCLIGNEKP